MLALDRYFHPVLASSKLRSKPISIHLDPRISREKIVVFRTKAGLVSAVADRCPHRGTPLSLGTVNEDSIHCPYHGWSVDRDGAVMSPTAGAVKNCRVQSFSAHEAHGFIWVATRPDARRAGFPSNDWVHMGGFELDIKAPLEMVLDNFNEDEHFPYVHKVLGWDAEGAKNVHFDFTPREDSIEVHYRGIQRDFLGKSLFLSPRGAYFNNTWTVQFDPVRISYTASTTDAEGAQIAPIRQHVVVYFVPYADGRTVLRVIQYSTLGMKKWNGLIRLLAPLVVGMTKWDFGFDKRLLEAMAKEGLKADTPIRYGAYDQPLFHARKLLKQAYFREVSQLRPPENGPDLMI